MATNILFNVVSGNFYWYEEAVGRSTTGDLFLLSAASVNIGNTLQDTDFKVFGGETNYMKYDCGLRKLHLSGTASCMDIAASGDATCSTFTDSFNEVLNVYSGVPSTGDDLSSGTPFCGIHSRSVWLKAQTNDISVYAIEGHFRPKAGWTQGVHAAVRGYVEESGSTTHGGQTSALLASVETSTGFTLSASSYLEGLRVESLVHDTCTLTGTLSGIYMAKGSGKEAFKYGIYMADDCALTPIAIVSTPTGATAYNAIDIDIDETYTFASGYARGFYVNITHTSGAITSASAELNGLGIDMGVTAGEVSQFYPISIYTGGCGTGTVGNLWAINVYMDDIGGSANVTNKCGLALGIDNGDGATNCDMIRFYNHGGTIKSALFFANSGETSFNHLCRFEGGVKPYVTATAVSTVAGVIQVDVGGTTRYLALYTGKT